MEYKHLIDYVKEHGGYVKKEIITPFDAPNLEITIEINNSELRIYDENGQIIATNESDLQDYLYDNYDTEIRFCTYCGSIMQAGFTDDDGDFYNCEECFPLDMDERYGKGNWRALQKENDWEGYYEYLNEKGKWMPEPSYYTEWY